MNNLQKNHAWLIPANEEIYDHQSSFDRNGFIDWHTAGRIFEMGDIVYIYSTLPVGEILYEAIVTKINIPFAEATNDKDFWKSPADFIKSRKGRFVRLKLVGVCNNHQLTYEELLKRGLKRPAPLSAMVLKDELLNFVESTFPLISTLKTIVPDDVYDEGSVDNTHKDFYERSRLARRKCIEEKGIRCSICGMSFEETYGPVGKGFIHVHHIKPISEFGEAHKVNPKKDLIPVCPNCHAMLHRKINGHYLSVEELRSLLEKKRS